MTPHERHLLWGALFVLVFSCGQFLFMLKRADLARRSPLNGINSIKQYFSLNWVVLLFRAVIEWGLFLWPYRSASASWIQSIVKMVWHSFPFQVPQHRGLIGAFFFGIGADLLIDWLLMQDWVKSVPILKYLMEQIPQLPEVKKLVDNLGEQKKNQNEEKD